MRLGSGPPGTPRDYAALKKHKFFSNINWESMHEQKPPVPIEEIEAKIKQKEKEI